MLKALFLDLDETLCDTTGANNQALALLADKCEALLGDCVDAKAFAQAYIKGIYRDLNARYQALLLPVINEETFRLQLIELILSDMGLKSIPSGTALLLQQTFDNARTEKFDFFEGIDVWLDKLRNQFTLVVITNGPEFSQVVKVDRVKLREKVDHVIIGGQEPEQKPAVSIFDKALALAGCEKHEVIHVGDSLEADIQGANNAGVDSVWISHGQELPVDHPAKPGHIITSPFELPALITSLKV